MRLSWTGLFVASLLFSSVVITAGCSEAPPCQTSLVTLDETRLDAETYEQEAAETGKNVADLEKKLSEKQKEISQVKDKPTELKRQAESMKKGSGRE